VKSEIGLRRLYSAQLLLHSSVAMALTCPRARFGVFLICYLEEAQTVRGLAAKLDISRTAICRAQIVSPNSNWSTERPTHWIGAVSWFSGRRSVLGPYVISKGYSQTPLRSRQQTGCRRGVLLHWAVRLTVSCSCPEGPATSSSAKISGCPRCCTAAGVDARYVRPGPAEPKLRVRSLVS
jgi:hypothetical protein